jgi:hypothetical protein
MQLDRLAVQLRLRNPWEAMDLGFAMARAWMPQVYGAWLAVAVPLYALALVLLPAQWATFVLWWLKPALDRVVLHVLANGVFGDLPRVRATLRALPQALVPGLFASLTWLRFAPARSFNLAVWQLERQRGAAARARMRQLQRRVGGNAVWLTAVCLHFELALGLSIVALYDLLVPGTEGAEVGLFQLLYGDAQATQWAMALIYFTVVTVLEPAYVAAGFALYLNRRTALEGWDLELALRRMSQRMSSRTEPPPAGAQPPAAPTPAVTVALLCTAAIVLALAAPPSHAQAVSPLPASGAARDPAVEVKQVYQRPELDPYEMRTRLEYLGPSKKRPPRAPDSMWRNLLGGAIGDLVRILAWAAVGLALVLLVYHLLRRSGLLERRVEGPAFVPSTLFGLDVRPETLPPDPAAVASQLAREGRILQALSLLYRGALATLLHRDGVELAGGDTEADCLRKSRARVPAPVHGYFAELLGAWLQAAYAGREVPRAAVEALCAQWPLHFGERRADGGAAR